MKLLTAIVLVLFGVSSNANKVDLPEITENYLNELIKESPLDFKVYFVNKVYHDDGSVKHNDVIVFANTPNKSADLSLSSLGTKKIEEMVKNAEEEGVELSVAENILVKNVTKTYGTKEQKEPDYPALQIFQNLGGYGLGVLEQVFEAVFGTQKIAKFYLYEYYANKAIKRLSTMTIGTKEVVVKDKKKMSEQMVEESSKLLKKAMKVDVDDKAQFIGHQFDDRYPKYKWNVLVNPVAYTCKSDVMISLKYDNNIYTILGTSASA
ncbi:hypothetical protein FQR65_LT12572 [Abscondita terminalis]|nr:hypothetical protein FQR65_LT12572 [Abscondita terminalis]